MVFNVDIEEFFPSINFGRVRGFFIRDRNFALHPSVATILAQVACSGNHLPQGSPCSPVIANLIGHILDMHLVKLAGRNGCRYTRYADDLTFSTNKKAFPEAIAIKVEHDSHQWTIGTELSHLVALCGFRINKKKTRMQYRDSRQEVTGLVVNRKVNVPSDYHHIVRAMVHNLFTTGAFEIVKAVASDTGVSFTKISGKVEQLHGMLGFIDSIDLHNRNLNPNENVRALSSKELTYRRFLLFQDFYAATKPVLVCEGKTDSVYLTHAIRSMATRFPRLASVDASKKVSLNIRRYRYANRSTGRVLGIGGGHGDLQKLLSTYRDALKRFKAPGLVNAIIVLIDNDSAAKPMLSTIKQITGIEPDRKAPFIHALANLYVVLTPLFRGKEISVIEDFFDDATRAIRVKGKAFDSSKTYSSASHYGKADFAYQVVQRKAETIDFSGFSQLLENISLAIEAHEKRLATIVSA
jgi:hypothetical protein